MTIGIRIKIPCSYTAFSRMYKYIYCILLIVCSLLVSGCGKRPNPIAPEEVWEVVSREGEKYNMNPSFIFAIAFAESRFDAHANSRHARGMMQISKIAWREVSDLSYRKAWDWRRNIEVGTKYLAHNRALLQKHRHFSYPLLAASYRYGFYSVKKSGFDIQKVKKPKSKIYQQLFAGTINPVTAPDA
jgi:hypothetical protein